MNGESDPVREVVDDLWRNFRAIFRLGRSATRLGTRLWQRYERRQRERQRLQQQQRPGSQRSAPTADQVRASVDAASTDAVREVLRERAAAGPQLELTPEGIDTLHRDLRQRLDAATLAQGGWLDRAHLQHFGVPPHPDWRRDVHQAATRKLDGAMDDLRERLSEEMRHEENLIRAESERADRDAKSRTERKALEASADKIQQANPDLPRDLALEQAAAAGVGAGAAEAGSAAARQAAAEAAFRAADPGRTVTRVVEQLADALAKEEGDEPSEETDPDAGPDEVVVDGVRYHRAELEAARPVAIGDGSSGPGAEQDGPRVRRLAIEGPRAAAADAAADDMATGRGSSAPGIGADGDLIGAAPAPDPAQMRDRPAPSVPGTRTSGSPMSPPGSANRRPIEVIAPDDPRIPTLRAILRGPAPAHRAALPPGRAPEAVGHRGLTPGATHRGLTEDRRQLVGAR